MFQNNGKKKVFIKKEPKIKNKKFNKKGFNVNEMNQHINIMEQNDLTPTFSAFVGLFLLMSL